MKKIFLLFPLLLVAMSCFGQIEKGNHLVGGVVSLDLSFSNDEEFSTFGLGIFPNYAVFLSDKFALGGQVGVSILTDRGSTRTFLRIGPAGRYYFARKDAGSNTPFLTASVGYEWSSFFTDGLDTSNEGVDVIAGVGYDIFLNEHVALEALLFYNKRSILGSHDVGISLGFQIFLAGQE